MQRCLVGIVPPHILEELARNGSAAQRKAALASLAQSHEIREARSLRGAPLVRGVQGVGPARKNRLAYTASNATALPGTLLRGEGGAASGDIDADEAYDALGATFDLYWNVFQRNGIDDNGDDLIGSVHYGTSFNNAFWNGTQMVFGDGDGVTFNRFTIAIDVIGHELAHGVTGATAGLVYQGQSGALNESMSDVFGSMVKQYSLNQTSVDADWLIGAGLFTAAVNGVALRSMRDPGTAYDDPAIGKDPQPGHLTGYVNTTADNGGVHINSGIPNRAFYLVAIALGGHSWDRAGQIWYRTLLDPRLSSNATFQQFADLTADIARQLYGEDVKNIVVRAWQQVGLSGALYRYFHTGSGDHFYTTTWEELFGGGGPWSYEGIQCYVSPDQRPGTVPLYRYFHNGSGDHFYTTSWDELGAGGNGWDYEGVQCFVYANQEPGTVPLYRYFNRSNADHFYTTSWDELGSGGGDWDFEGIQCFVQPQPMGVLRSLQMPAAQRSLLAKVTPPTAGASVRMMKANGTTPSRPVTSPQRPTIAKRLDAAPASIMRTEDGAVSVTIRIDR